MLQDAQPAVVKVLRAPAAAGHKGSDRSLEQRDRYEYSDEASNSLLVASRKNITISRQPFKDIRRGTPTIMRAVI